MDYEYEGDLSVLRQLKNSALNPWLVIGPGTMRGVYGGGKVTALEERQLTQGVAGMVGVSTGAPTAAYSLAGQARLGTSIYYEECTSREFISFNRLFQGPVVDIDYLAAIFRYGAKKLNQKAIYTASSELWFGVTEYDRGLERFVDSKYVKPDIVHGVQISCAMPGVYRKQLHIEGVRHNDGAISCSPLRFALSKSPSGIILFANRPRVHAESKLKSLGIELLMLRESKIQRALFRSRHRVYKQDYDELRSAGIPYLIVYSDSSVGSFTRDAECLKRAAKRSCAYMHWLLDCAGM